MPLDTKDLAAIEEIVSRQIETKVPAIIDERVPAIVETKLASIKADIADLKKDVSEMKKDVAIPATPKPPERHQKTPDCGFSRKPMSRPGFKIRLTSIL